MRKLFAGLALVLASFGAMAQSYPSPTYNNVTINGTATVPHAAITGGSIAGTPISGSTGAFTNSTVSGTFTVTNGTDVINANNNANNVLVFSGTGTSTAKSIATTSMGGFIASSDANVSDGVAFKSDFPNTAIFQGLNSSGTSGYDTNLTLYRPASTNNAFLGVTMSANPSAEQHLWMGTDYANNRYIFTETVTGTGAYLPIAFYNGQGLAYQIGTGTTPTTTFSGGGVVLNGSEGNQITWTLGGTTWSWNMAPAGNFYVHDGTNNKFPLSIAPNATAALLISGSTSAFTGNVTMAGDVLATGRGSMPVYIATGASFAAPHQVIGTIALSSGSATVTFSGNAAFTSSTSYACTANDTTAANAVRVNQTAGTSVTFVGTGTDTVQYACTGN